MNYRVIFSQRAEQQLRNIEDYIESRSSSVIAQRFVDDIVRYCFGFDVFPERGARRGDLSPGLRLVGFRRAVTIAFVINGDEVIISGIFYGGEDYEQALTIGEP